MSKNDKEIIISIFFMVFSFNNGRSGQVSIALILIGLITYSWWPKIRDTQQVLLTRLSLPTMQFFDLSFGTNFLPEKVFYACRSEWVAPPGVNDEAVAAKRLLGAISDYSDTELDKIRVILAGNPMLIDSGVMQYIFLSKTDKYLLQRFFYQRRQGILFMRESCARFFLTGMPGHSII